jgi:nucleoid DNA-binding protein
MPKIIGNSISSKDFINQLAVTNKVTQKEASDFVESFWDAIHNNLKQGNRVSFSGWGVFKIQSAKPRKARNPKTGEVVDVPAKTRPKFTCGKVLKCLQ